MSDAASELESKLLAPCGMYCGFCAYFKGKRVHIVPDVSVKKVTSSGGYAKYTPAAINMRLSTAVFASNYHANSLQDISQMPPIIYRARETIFSGPGF